MTFDWKKTVKAIAPLIGTAVGGPLGTVATMALTSALGISPESTEDQIEAAVKNATPDQLLQLKKADQQFKKDMRELDIKEDQLHADDRDSARKREAALGGDPIVKGIALYTVVAFSAMMGFLLWKGTPDGMDKILLGTIIGYVAAMAQQVYNYYFGSSKGSTDKNKISFRNNK